tara:strand:- start:52 stop:789 length:738 start_codon:yes stop_codon:yes gene_type:complete
MENILIYNWYMNQLNLSLRFIKNNLTSLISFSLPWFIFSIIFIYFIIGNLASFSENQNNPEDLIIFFQNNSFNFNIIDIFIDVLFCFFIGSLTIQFNNIYERKSPGSFIKIAKKIYYKIPYLFISGFLSGILVTIGLLLLILPGIYLFGRFALFPIFIALENKGPIESLKDSWEYTDEFGDKLFLYTFMIGVLLFLVILITSFLLTLSSITAIILVPVILFEIIIFSMILNYIYFTLYKHLKNNN